MNSDDLVAIAVDPTLPRRRAAAAAREAAAALDDAGIPIRRRCWIIAAGADDARTARIVAAVADSVDGARLILHDPHEPDDLIFQRRLPGQRRGGVYLNADWISASARIVIGNAETVARGLCGFFNPPESVDANDLDADLVLD